MCKVVDAGCSNTGIIHAKLTFVTCHLRIYRPNLFSLFHSAQTHRTMETLFSLVPEQKGPTSGAAIIVPGGQQVSYGDLRASTLSFRDILRKVYGVRTGDVVGMSLINSAEFVIAFMAIGTARRVQSPTIPTRNYLLVN